MKNINQKFPNVFSFLNTNSFLYLLSKTFQLSSEGTGLLINRLIMPKINEAFKLLEQGNHHPYEIDNKLVIGNIKLILKN